MKLTKTLFGLMLGGLLTAASPMFADNVQYYTTGTFSDSGKSVVGNALNGLSFSGNGTPFLPDSVDAPTEIQLGSFAEYGFTTYSPTGTFTLTVDQTKPAQPSGGITSTELTGTFTTSLSKGDSSTAVLSFGSPTMTIDGVGYTTFMVGDAEYGVQSTTALPADSTTTLYGYVLDPAVPEPGCYALTGSGLIGLLAAAIRRKRSKVA